MPATQKRTVTKATVPFKGKMKKVLRDEAKALSLIAGRLVGASPVAVDAGMTLVCKGPGHCAVGALMFAAGISNKRIAKFEAGGVPLDSYGSGPIARVLFDAYHIDQEDVSDIINQNDSVANTWYNGLETHKQVVQNRLDTVLNTISGLPKRTRVRPPLKETF